MAIIRCVRGHFYDSEKFEDCPTCKNLDQRTSELRNRLYPGFSGTAGTMNEDVTVPLFQRGGHTVEVGGERQHSSGGASDEDGVTVALFSKAGGTALVTGWIVCVEGPLKGRDFRLCHGMNWVGLSMDSDICLSGASEVSLNKHCSIVYDIKSNQFFIVAEKGIVYMEDEAVREPKKLSVGSRIRIGNCSFEFIPFCREGQLWKEITDPGDGNGVKGVWSVAEGT